MIIDESAVRFVMMVNMFIELRRIPDISDIVYRNIFLARFGRSQHLEISFYLTARWPYISNIFKISIR